MQLIHNIASNTLACVFAPLGLPPHQAGTRSGAVGTMLGRCRAEEKVFSLPRSALRHRQSAGVSERHRNAHRPQWRLPIIVVGAVIGMLLWLLLDRAIPKESRG
jgi:hypothetical protein